MLKLVAIIRRVPYISAIIGVTIRLATLTKDIMVSMIPACASEVNAPRSKAMGMT